MAQSDGSKPYKKHTLFPFYTQDWETAKNQVLFVCLLFLFAFSVCFFFDTITTIQGNIARQYCPQQGLDWQLRQNRCL